jgi:Smg protein
MTPRVQISWIDGQEELEKRQQGDAPGMKENVLDVLMYLFETYIDAEEEPEPDQNELRDELSRAGFGDSEIDRALDWLDGLTDNHDGRNFNFQTEHGTRIYNEIENDRLNSPCRYYLPRTDRHSLATAARNSHRSLAGA